MQTSKTTTILATNWSTSRVRIVIPEIVREGDVIAFKFGADFEDRGFYRHTARRAAVAWMATHPKEQRGVRVYRFDVGEIRDAF